MCNCFFRIPSWRFNRCNLVMGDCYDATRFWYWPPHSDLSAASLRNPVTSMAWLIVDLEGYHLLPEHWSFPCSMLVWAWAASITIDEQISASAPIIFEISDLRHVVERFVIQLVLRGGHVIGDVLAHFRWDVDILYQIVCVISIPMRLLQTIWFLQLQLT